MVAFAVVLSMKEGTGAKAVSVFASVVSASARTSALLAASDLKRGFTRIEAIFPDATMVARSSLPQKAPSAMLVHSGAIATLAPMPAGAAMRV